jgi:hypothetical protein
MYSARALAWLFLSVREHLYTHRHLACARVAIRVGVRVRDGCKVGCGLFKACVMRHAESLVPVNVMNPDNQVVPSEFGVVYVFLVRVSTFVRSRAGDCVYPPRFWFGLLLTGCVVGRSAAAR